MMTKTLANALLSNAFLSVPLPLTPFVYVGLLNSTGEVNAPEYARLPIPASAEGFTLNENDCSVSNAQSHSFAFPNVDWATEFSKITRLGVYNQAEGGDLLVECAFSSPFTVLAKSPPVVLMEGQLSVQLLGS